MEYKFEISRPKALINLVAHVVGFFLCILLGLIVFDSKTLIIKAAFLLFALVILGLTFLAYRLYSGAYFLQIKDGKLVLSRALSKININLADIEKVDLIKSKNPIFKSDDVLHLEYKQGKTMQKADFLLFFLKEKGDKIYSSIVSSLEK